MGHGILGSYYSCVGVTVRWLSVFWRAGNQCPPPPPPLRASGLFVGDVRDKEWGGGGGGVEEGGRQTARQRQ